MSDSAPLPAPTRATRHGEGEIAPPRAEAVTPEASGRTPSPEATGRPSSSEAVPKSVRGRTGNGVPALDETNAAHAAAFAAAASADPAAIAGRGPVTLPVLEDRSDRPVDLSRRFADRRVILVFYLGGWSAPCLAALGVADRARAALDERCCSIVGVSPETVGRLGDTEGRGGLGLTLLHDHAARFAQSLDLAIRLDAPQRADLRAAGVRLSAWNGESSGQLALPVTLLVDFDRGAKLFVPTPASGLRDDVARAIAAASDL